MSSNRKIRTITLSSKNRSDIRNIRLRSYRNAENESRPSNYRNLRRDLPTNSAKWRAIRRWYLELEPWCAQHESLGQFVPSTVLDHIDGDANNNSSDNYQTLCASCHNRKSRYEQSLNKGEV